MSDETKPTTSSVDEAREKDTPKSKPAEGVEAGKSNPKAAGVPTGSAGKEDGGRK
ncbi:hypothetical protein [Methylobacterium brachythecii]|uniref:Uncharacterized protein n=1 Tax=Methylobacterium brachythecii TaxID=1176177 RepID=A0A7W6AN02_9HYPH|nr:hypothetical protein [Methylobacterium brachythecii]MBB3904214.1 hypothetical protein [Methylobacterium brachythecii]GLS45124.1 hypothetical protein GCM10007884_31130 [Methylobacterium brachythecii]